MLWLDPLMGIPFVMLVTWWVIKWWHAPRIILDTEKLLEKHQSTSTSVIMESVNGVRVISDYGQQIKSLTCMAEAQDDKLANLTAVCNSRCLRSLQVLGQISPWMSLVSLLAVYMHREPRPANVGLTLFLIDRFNIAARELLCAVNQTNKSVDSLARFTALISSLPKERYKSETVHRWHASEGAIEFRNAFFQYRPQLPFVMNNFSLKVQRGEKIGVCGRTGVGKTTIINALFQFAELRKNQIFIDGQDVAEIGVHDLRSSIAILPQQTILFRGTLRSNLDPDQQICDEVLWDALHRSGFCQATTKRVHLDYVVESGGANFSLGEKQLIALARVLLKICKIILLDEATAAVDFATDQFIQERIRREFVNCTVLCVAHRIQSIARYDRVIALGVDSKITEIGKPQELHSRRGLFWEMCEDAGVEESDF